MILFNENKDATAIELVNSRDIESWRSKQSETTLSWADRAKFRGTANQHFAVPDEQGLPNRLISGIGDEVSLSSIGSLPGTLPHGNYRLELDGIDDPYLLYLGWGLGSYRFNDYKASPAKVSDLHVPEEFRHVAQEVDAINLTRDLINTPASDMLPHHLEAAARSVATDGSAEIEVTIGTDLLKKGYRTIHAVGQASASEPRLIDIQWGSEEHPKVTLLGKGVCFDSGGLDLKSAVGMRSMKKDMSGAATVLGLAKLIMARNLPIRLRVLIPAVENAVSGNAYRPGDVVRTYKGTTVEIGNTDAEGRLILCDALALAAEEQPDLMVDYASLTAAARTAVGADISAMFANRDDVARAIEDTGNALDDPICRLPLFQAYKTTLKSSVADVCNISAGNQAGAITAALFLEHFVDDNSWVHFDIMGSNDKNRPARPEGGEAMGLRAVYQYLADTYQNE